MSILLFLEPDRFLEAEFTELAFKLCVFGPDFIAYHGLPPDGSFHDLESG